MASIIGIDEVGIGPWAGPVVAGAVCFMTKIRLKGLADSKQLTPLKREKLFKELHEYEKKGKIAIGFGIVDNRTIDRIGIRKSNKLAMEQALAMLKEKIAGVEIEKIIVDGRDNFKFEGNTLPTEYMIKGDDKINEIKAASIIAKVTRDNIMKESSLLYPGYGFESNCGYGTKAHQKALSLLGVCEIHRKYYAPIKNILISEANPIS